MTPARRRLIILIAAALILPGGSALAARRAREPQGQGGGAGPGTGPVVGRLMAGIGVRLDRAGRRLPVGAEELRLYGRLAALDTTVSPPTLRVWMKLDEEGRVGVEAAGIRLESRVGGLASAIVPLPRLPALGEVRGIEWIRASEPLEPETDASVPEMLAGPAILPYRAFGEGAIVGIIDTGIDWSHPDFRNPDGSTRLLSYWDQTDDCGSPPPPFSYGCYYTQADIAAALAAGPPYPTAEADGHGTHVAGTAAGSGGASPSGSFYAPAPEADIIGVKIFEEPGAPSCASCDGGDGLTFLAGEAAAFGRPLAANMSFGTSFTLEGRDGSAPLEMLIDSTIGPGIPGLAVSKSAGNLRGIPMHVSGSVSTGATVSRTWTVPSYTPLAGIFNDAQVFTIYYDPADTLTITVSGPTFGSLTASTGDGFVGTGTVDGVIIIDDSVGPTPLGAPWFYVQVDDQLGTAPRPGTWTVEVHGDAVAGSGEFDMWIAFSSYGAGELFGPWTAPEDTMLTSIPATSFNVTAVGAHVTKTSWPNDSGGTTSYTSPPPLGELADFSSPGPSRDGRVKPEITAGGMGIGAALSQDATPFVPPLRLLAGGNRWVLEGTSMSSPHIAGGFAALLGINPGLDAIQLREIVTSTARTDAFTGAGLPDQDWGHGKADLMAALDFVIKDIPDLDHVGGGSTFGSATGWPGADSYNVYRSDASALSDSSFGACLRTGLATPFFTDTSVPLPGQAYTYVMTAVQSGIEGQAGFRTEPPPPGTVVAPATAARTRSHAGLTCPP